MEIKIKQNKKNEFTERDKKLIEYIAAGWTDAEISNEIGVASISVRQIVGKLLSKSNTYNRPQLVYWAIKNGILRV